jgi:hypothetical protein
LTQTYQEWQESLDLDELAVDLADTLLSYFTETTVVVPWDGDKTKGENIQDFIDEVIIGIGDSEAHE